MSDNKSRQVIRELFIGIAIYTAFFALLGIPLMRPYLFFAAGLLAGAAVSCICILLLYEDLDRALDMGSDGARKYVMVRGMLRLILRVLIMAGAFFLNVNCFYGAAVGMLSTKGAAYLHTFISKHITKTYVPAPVESEDASSDDLDKDDDEEPDFDDIEARMERK